MNSIVMSGMSCVHLSAWENRMPWCRDMSTQIEKWMKRAVSPELQKEPLIVFHFNWVFGMTMEVFISGRSLEQERTLNMIDTWAGVEEHEHLILYDVLKTCSKQVRNFKKSSIEDNNFTSKRLKVGCFQAVHVRLRSSPLFTNFPSLFATFRYQSRTSVPALVSQSFCKAINQTRELRSQIYNFHSRCVCLRALAESLCDCSRVQ